MKTMRPLFAAAAAVVAVACVVNVPDVINGSGSVRTEQRAVGAFGGIEIKNGIKLTQNYTSSAGVVARVVTPSLPELALIAGANVDGAGIAETAMSLRLESGAVATLSGTVESLTLSASDGALLNLGGLSARTSTVTLQNGVTGTMAATGTVAGSASNGVLLTVTGGAAVNVSTSGGAIATSQ